MALGDKGTVFVGTRQLKDVYAVVDRDGKREVKTLLRVSNRRTGSCSARARSTSPSTTASRATTVSRASSTIRLRPKSSSTASIPESTRPLLEIPRARTRRQLYYNVGAPGNIVMPAYFQASISRVDPNTGITETYVQGVRNSVGFDWHPKTKQLWFTEHGRDWLGDNSPSDELNVVTRKGQHFGYPYCHQGDTLRPEFGKNRSCAEFTPPALKLGAHIAPIGMRFYTGKMFPAEYQNNIFIAFRGSWNRTIKQGYKRHTRELRCERQAEDEPFLTGFLQDEKADPPMWGRPADVMVMRDGSLLVSDDTTESSTA